MSRSRGVLPLPIPERGGSLAALRRFLRLGKDVAGKGTFLLIVGWLVGIFNLVGTRPPLQINGEQGSGKSSLARFLVALVDPNVMPLRSAPREEDALVIGAANRAVIAYDNLSYLPEWLSDSLCRMASGGGIGKRQLFSDFDEVMLDVQRSVILTGITNIITQSDLFDRAITIILADLTDDERQRETALWRDFEEARPKLLVALLDAVSQALARRDQIHLPQLPRLADFVVFVEAAAPALGWKDRQFFTLFAQSRAAVDWTAIEASAIGPVVIRLMTEQAAWHGTATELLAALNARVAETTQRAKVWPSQPNKLSEQLNRLKPNLRRIGIVVTTKDREGGTGTRLITLARNEAWQAERKTSSQSSRSSQQAESGDDQAPNCDDQRSANDAQSDGGGDGDDQLHHLYRDPLHHRFADDDEAEDTAPSRACPRCGEPLIGSFCPLCC